MSYNCRECKTPCEMSELFWTWPGEDYICRSCLDHNNRLAGLAQVIGWGCVAVVLIALAIYDYLI